MRDRARNLIFDMGMLAADEDLLDNPAYVALGGQHARFAQVRGRVRRYAPDVAPFLAMPAQPSEQDWRDAAGLLEPGVPVGVAQTAAELPDGWLALRVFDLVQMVGDRVRGAECAESITLGAADVSDMLALVAETEPGPFLNRTIELGAYLGIRRDGVLVAMAGERFRLDGWTEISAVCTRSSHRGQGLARALMGALIAAIHSRSEGVFLHVLATNTGAIRLYRDMGFRVRQTATLTVVTLAE